MSSEENHRLGRPSNFSDEALKSLAKFNLWQSTQELGKYIICCHLEKTGKASKLGNRINLVILDANAKPHTTKVTQK